MLISEAVIADTINKLRRSGKTMPQRDRMDSAADKGKMATKILQETVALWMECFAPQKISVERWKKAESVALTMSDGMGLNLNIISPALMQEALKRNEELYLEEMRVKHEQEKKEEASGVQLDDSTFAQRKKALLWHWTTARMAAMRWPRPPQIMADMPSDLEVRRLATQMGLEFKDVEKNYKLLQIYLADIKHCNRCLAQKNCQYRCYLHKRRKELVVENGEVSFKECACVEYAKAM